MKENTKKICGIIGVTGLFLLAFWLTHPYLNAMQAGYVILTCLFTLTFSLLMFPIEYRKLVKRLRE